ncbi:MAG: hypothetical protein ACLGIA_12020 [Actinomycetes bacterium]
MSVLDWLLDGDPSLRWQVLQDLNDSRADEVAAERAKVATEGWGAQLLALQGHDGQWDGGTYRPGWVDESKPFFDAWTATTYVLLDLCHLGLPPGSPQARHGVGLVRDNSRWQAAGTLFFTGETEPCINGMVLSIGAYFAQDVDGIVTRLLDDQLPDGGWNCWAELGAEVSSFSTTLTVLEGLLAWQQAGGSTAEVDSARRRGEEYLLERRLFRRRSNGRVVDPRFTMFSYPTRWYYDVLRALDYFRSTRAEPDPRCAEAVELVLDKREDDGRWLLENTHQGPTHLEMEGPDGFPSRWNTLRALRVLRWWHGDAAWSSV